MKKTIPLVVFRLGAQRYAVQMNAVERVVRAVEVTRLPNAPGIVVGIIDVGGTILPVLNLRRRLGLPEKEISPADQFLIMKTARRAVVLVIDEALEVVERAPEEIVATAGIVPHVEHLQGAMPLADGLVLIHDVETFLSMEEAEAIHEALDEHAAHAS